MAREFAKRFYSSIEWQQVRNNYSAKKHHLCEKCLNNGLIVAGEIVHHKIEVTPENIDNPEITMNEENLELLCRKCHGAIHGSKRFSVDENGIVSPLYDK